MSSDSVLITICLRSMPANSAQWRSWNRKDADGRVLYVIFSVSGCAVLTLIVADHLERPLLRIGSIDDNLNEESKRGSEFKAKIDKATEWGGLVLFDGKMGLGALTRSNSS